jgi:hypothetical protein
VAGNQNSPRHTSIGIAIVFGPHYRLLVDCKDKPWKGGPYERCALVACTNEFLLDRNKVSRFLQGAVFRTKLITDVFFGLSYHDAILCSTSLRHGLVKRPMVLGPSNSSHQCL